MAACQGSTCRSGRRPCLSPEKCGLLNETAPANRPSFVPRDAQITVDSWPPLSRRTIARIERWARPALVALAIGLFALWIFVNWRSLAALAGA